MPAKINDGLTNQKRYRIRHLAEVRKTDAAAKQAARATPEGKQASDAALAKFRSENRARLAAAAREFRKTPAGVATEQRRVRNPDVPSSHACWHRYRLTPDQRKQMFIDQGGVCKICKRVPARPNVDHCHRTGRVRGIVCQRCNIWLGHIETEGYDQWLIAAAEYLKE